eukprot:scaffold27952_cov16-Tisochrysis_lutea.AAC.1
MQCLDCGAGFVGKWNGGGKSATRMGLANSMHAPSISHVPSKLADMHGIHLWDWPVPHEKHGPEL